MSGLNSNQNYFIQDNRSTSRVLNPPGGRSSFSIGGYAADREPAPRKQDSRDPPSDFQPRRSPRHRPPPVVHSDSRRQEEDLSCDIPGLQDHYRSLSTKFSGSSNGSNSRPPRDYDRESRDAASSVKSNVRAAEGESVRRRSPSYEYETGRSGLRDRGRAESPTPVESGPSAGERALMQAKKQALERNAKDKPTRSTRGSFDKPPAASRRAAPARDSYENALSSEPRRRDSRDSSLERRQRATGSGRQARGGEGVKLAGGMDRRGPQIPPGGNSTLSLGWE